MISTVLLQPKHISDLPFSGELAVLSNLHNFAVGSAGRVKGAACLQEAGTLVY